MVHRAQRVASVGVRTHPLAALLQRCSLTSVRIGVHRSTDDEVLGRSRVAPSSAGLHADHHTGVPPCKDGACLFARADADGSGCLDPTELNEFVEGVWRVVHGWVAYRARSLACCRGGALTAESSNVACVDLTAAGIVSVCMYGDSIEFLF
jgi:hypothetical protein